MKKATLVLVIIAAFIMDCVAQEKSETQQFMQITTIESVIGGGAGRSRLIITKPDGSQEEKDLNNLFSIGGINFKNIKENESDIIRILKQYSNEGWKLIQTTPLTLSPRDGNTGIFMTRYLLSKEEEKKGV